jgi:hypothetical protein
MAARLELTQFQLLPEEEWLRSFEDPPVLSS